MSRAAAILFGALVVATFGGFFATQRLKASPGVLSGLRQSALFSPNADGRLDAATVRFRLRTSGRVAVGVLDADGDEVRRLIGGRSFGASREVRARWDGRDGDGRRVPDGVYRLRITLPDQGRNVVLPRPVRLDSTPPRPRVASVGPVADAVPGPELLPLPGGGDAVAHVAGGGHGRQILLFRTGPGPAQVAAPPIALPDGATDWRWNGRLPSGQPALPGTYLVAVRAFDRAGNVGTSVPLDARGLPAPTYGSAAPGRGGITVRALAVQPPTTPVRAGRRAAFGVDTRGLRWAWSVRRVGSGAVIRRGRHSRGGVFHLTAPGRESGVYLYKVRTRAGRVWVPFAVQGMRRRRVLVVLPTITWQGRNPVDDDGDGLPNLLDRGLPVRVDRVFAGNGLPNGFARRDAPLLAWLTRTRRRYDITTDAALAASGGAQLRGYRGVLLPSDTRWLPRVLQERLQAFVRNGGTLLSFGLDSLRRQVTLSADGRLSDPTPAASADLFGGRLAALVHAPLPVTLTEAVDRIQLFAGTTGEFAGWRTLELLDAPGDRAQVLAAAVSPAGRPALSAVRFGRGLVLRFGVPELPGRLTRDETDPPTALMARAWTLLSR